MAVKISDLPIITTATDDDYLPMVDPTSGQTRRILKSDLLKELRLGTDLGIGAVKANKADFSVADQTARDALTPFEGLLVFRKDLDCFQFYTGSRWRYVTPRQLELKYGTGGPTVLTASYVDQITSSSNTTLGGLVEIEANIFAYNAGSGSDRTLDVLLLCDGATVGTFTLLSIPLNATANGYYEFTLTIQHTPSAAAHTWKVQARGSTASAVGFVNTLSSIKIREIG